MRKHPLDAAWRAVQADVVSRLKREIEENAWFSVYPDGIASGTVQIVEPLRVKTDAEYMAEARAEVEALFPASPD